MSERPVRKHMHSSNLITRGVSKKFFNTTIEDFNDYGQDELYQVKLYIKDYLENLPSKYDIAEGLFFRGSNGVGKSMLASLIVKEAYRRYYTSKRATFVDYIGKYTELWSIKNSDVREEAEGLFYHEYKAVDFLVLEELGKEIDSKVAIPILEDLLRYREERGLPTIICTNLDLPNIEERYGASILSLIKGNMTPIVIVGEDKRMSKFKEVKLNARKRLKQ